MFETLTQQVAIPFLIVLAVFIAGNHFAEMTGGVNIFGGWIYRNPVTVLANLTLILMAYILVVDFCLGTFTEVEIALADHFPLLGG